MSKTRNKASTTPSRVYTVKRNPNGPLGPSYDVLRPDGTCETTCGGGADWGKSRAKAHAAKLNDKLAAELAASPKGGA